MTTEFKCSRCGVTQEITNKLACGYALTEKNEKICYYCCADDDREYMEKEGKGTMYLEMDDYGYKVTNWPGTLTIRLSSVKKGKHNFAKVRYDCWFLFQGRNWHGVTYGDNTQICHVKRSK